MKRFILEYTLKGTTFEKNDFCLIFERPNTLNSNSMRSFRSFSLRLNYEMIHLTDRKSRDMHRFINF